MVIMATTDDKWWDTMTITVVLEIAVIEGKEPLCSFIFFLRKWVEGSQKGMVGF